MESPVIVELCLPENMIHSQIVKVVKLSDGTVIKCDIKVQDPNDYYERKNHGPLLEFLMSGKTQIRIHIRDIVYISVEKHWCNFVFLDGNPLSAYGNLNTVMTILNSCGYTQFIRVHDSYIINTDYIISVDKKFIRLEKLRCTVPIGRTYKNELEKISFFINLKEKK